MSGLLPLLPPTALDYFATLVAEDASLPLLEAAVAIAQHDFPRLDVQATLAEVDTLAARLRRRLAADAAPMQRLRLLNRFFFQELGFSGNVNDYYDPRNSYVHCVLETRRGIPITLALLYMEVARRAGLHVEGINFPGHFLLRCPPRRGQPYSEGLIIDAFHGGAILSEDACRELLRRHAGDDAVYDSGLQGRATKTQILVRMLLNLKRTYVQMYSFPQARDVIELLLAVAPSTINEIRDRGLLAYHLKDFSAALRDLQQYLRLAPKTPSEEDDRGEHEQIWEHVKSLRRHVASLN